MQNKEFLGTEPIGKLLLKLAIPTVLAQLVNMLYNIVDRIFIGHIEGVGKLALEGIGICMPIIMAISAFAALISSGGAPRASICLGEGKPKDAERILGNCFTLQIIVSAILTAIILIFNRDLLFAFGANDVTIEYATDYMNIYAIGTIFVQLTLGMNTYITAQGATKVGMISVLIGAVANIALDPIFIYLLDMGIKGAALATIISQALSCAWTLFFLFGKKTILKIRKENIGVNPKVILPCIALGLAPFMMQLSESVILIAFNSSLTSYGDPFAVGAMTILSSIMQFAMLPLQGVAYGAQPITSYNYGAKNKERVKESFFMLLKVSLTYSVVLWAAIMLFPSAFASIFTYDKDLIEFTSGALRIYCSVLLIFGIQVAAQMTFISLGKALSSVVVAGVRKFVLLLPLIYIVPQFVENKTMGVYLAEPIADTLAVTFTAILFIFQFRKILKEMDKI